MKEIELYDIITLEDKTEYTVLKMIKELNKVYYLLAPIDEEEEPDMGNVKIVERQQVGEKVIVKELENQELQQDLAKKFLTLLSKEIE